MVSSCLNQSLEDGCTGQKGHSHGQLQYADRLQRLNDAQLELRFQENEPVQT